MEELPQLLAALNSGATNFSEFVRQMRRSFCNIAAARPT